MFNVGFAELILILLVAFLVVGPQDLPKVARWLGRLIKQGRRMFTEFQEEVGLESTVEELKEVQRDLNTTISKADPRKDITDAKRDFEKALRESKEATYLKKKETPETKEVPETKGIPEKVEKQIDSQTESSK